MTSAPVQAVLDRLQAYDVKAVGSGFASRCPHHGANGGDRKPSLSIGQGDDGRALVHCHAGCALSDVLRAINLTEPDLFPPKADAPQADKGRITATYAYIDETGNLLFEVVRFTPKDFRQRRPDGKGGWIWDTKGVRRVLYRLRELQAANPTAWIFLTEGEKDTESLRAVGLTATCNCGGAGKWRAEYSEALRGRRVCIVAHKDVAGRKHGQTVAPALCGVAACVRVLEMPGDGIKDAADYIEARDGADAETLRQEIEALAEAAPDWTAPAPEDEAAPVLVCMADVEPREVKWLWLGRIPRGRLTLLVGRPGEGKSFLATDLAARVSTGTPWPDGTPCPQGTVIIISAEDDPGDTIRPRLDAHRADCRRVHLLTTVRRIDEKGKPYEVVFTLVDMAALEAALKMYPDTLLIIIDPIGSFLGRDTDAHRDNEVRAVLAPVAKLAETYGAAVLIIAHRRKAGGTFADDLEQFTFECNRMIGTSSGHRRQSLPAAPT